MTQSKKSEDTFTIDISNMSSGTDTYTLSGDDSIVFTDTTSSITLTDYVVDTVDLTNITTVSGDFDWDNMGTINIDRRIFDDYMPDAGRINDMCKEYPALAKAYENFKTIYKMVDQDYKGKYEDNDEFPF
jgi:hypothetical protein